MASRPRPASTASTTARASGWASNASLASTSAAMPAACPPQTRCVRCHGHCSCSTAALTCATRPLGMYGRAASGSTSQSRRGDACSAGHCGVRLCVSWARAWRASQPQRAASKEGASGKQLMRGAAPALSRYCGWYCSSESWLRSAASASGRLGPEGKTQEAPRINTALLIDSLLADRHRQATPDLREQD